MAGRGIMDFVRRDSGAVTVDWVVVAAASAGLGLAAAAAVRDGTGALGSDINASLQGASVVALGDIGAPAWPGAGLTNGICPGRAALRASYDALIASGETFDDLVTGGVAASFDESPFGRWLDEAQATGFSADEFVVSYTWWQTGTGPGNDASREFTARLFACTLEASPTNWSTMPGGSLAGFLLADMGFVMPPR